MIFLICFLVIDFQPPPLQKTKKNNTYFEVVAPPMSTGMLMPTLSNSLTLKIISSSDGVMSPDIPTKSEKEYKNSQKGLSLSIALFT